MSTSNRPLPADGAPISPPPTKRRRISSSHGRASAEQASVANTAPAPDPENDNTLRVFSWNINGISHFTQPTLTSYLQHPQKNPNKRPTTTTTTTTTTSPPPVLTTSLRNFLHRHHWPHILHLQEVKINPADTSTLSSVTHAVNHCRHGTDHGPRYLVRFCLPRDAHNARGFGRKVYGVASVIREDFFERYVTGVREVGWDLEGRVLVTEVEMRDRKLSVWNVYAVNGTASVYRDPETGALAGTRHDRKLAFHAAIAEEFKKLQDEGWSLIVAGDLNVARDDIDGYPKLRRDPVQHVRNREDFNAKFFDDPTGPRLVDAFRWLHPRRKKYTWLPRNREWRSSCDRVDYTLLSRGLMTDEAVVEDDDTQGTSASALVAADILMTEQERGPSDHVPLFVELALDRLGDAGGDGGDPAYDTITDS
ncbi:MAG: hypothetical protein M1831_002091 [Alyxoria varia]|nr:MAG: hypothetical protein M1831_002091 [Alyxoria varia]